ncbi:MAG: hypothetical protein OEM67_10680 [Thermoleophilia bacterium]|nr:hypothetical protein [Thermoleophilia bacterium]
MTIRNLRLLQEPPDEQLGLGLVAAGVVASLLGALARSRMLRLVGLLASLAGVAMLVRGRLEQREEQILSAEERIRSELDDLDPVARARLLADLADSELSSD